MNESSERKIKEISVLSTLKNYSVDSLFGLIYSGESGLLARGGAISAIKIFECTPVTKMVQLFA